VDLCVYEEQVLMNVTADAIVNILAGADAPLSSLAVAKALRTSQTKKVVGVLTCLVREETLERVGRQYRLRDPGSYDVPLVTGQGTRRTLLPTDKQAIAAGGRRKEVAKRAKLAKQDTAGGVNVFEDELPDLITVKPLFSPDEIRTLEQADRQGDEAKPITTLEEIEAKVDENKARDQRIRNAIERLKCKASQQVEPVSDLNFKIEILDGLGGTDADLVGVMKMIVADLRRLDALAV